MSNYVLATPTASVVFPVGTQDTTWVFLVTGTLADGTAFSNSQESASPTAQLVLQPGTYSLVVTKNGISSQPSDPLVVVVPTVVLLVPDATQKATIVVAA